MHRRTFLSIATALILLASPTAALADRADDVVEWLVGQGYTDIQASRTLLGRARVLAWLNGLQRELIVNPRTGEILRDLWLDADGRIWTLSDGGDKGAGEDDGGDEGGGDDNSGDDSGDDDDGSDDGGDGGDDSGDGGDDGGSDGGDDDS